MGPRVGTGWAWQMGGVRWLSNKFPGGICAVLLNPRILFLSVPVCVCVCDGVRSCVSKELSFKPRALLIFILHISRIWVFFLPLMFYFPHKSATLITLVFFSTHFKLNKKIQQFAFVAIIKHLLGSSNSCYTETIKYKMFLADKVIWSGPKGWSGSGQVQRYNRNGGNTTRSSGNP